MSCVYKKEAFQEIERLAFLFDSKFKGPFGLRFGFDSLIGLVPIFGDLIGVVVSLYIVTKGIRLGCSKSVILKMLLNIAIDFFVGSIPVLGDTLDVFWKANSKNINLLRNYCVKI